jgi:hypothetical protein
VIYRRLGISDWECPGLFNLRTDLQERHYGTRTYLQTLRDSNCVQAATAPQPRRTTN